MPKAHILLNCELFRNLLRVLKPHMKILCFDNLVIVMKFHILGSFSLTYQIYSFVMLLSVGR